MLYIVPTLTSDNIGTAAVFDGTVYNITGCTFNITRPEQRLHRAGRRPRLRLGFVLPLVQRGEQRDRGHRESTPCRARASRTQNSASNPLRARRDPREDAERRLALARDVDAAHAERVRRLAAQRRDRSRRVAAGTALRYTAQCVLFCFTFSRTHIRT